MRLLKLNMFAMGSTVRTASMAQMALMVRTVQMAKMVKMVPMEQMVKTASRVVLKIITTEPVPSPARMVVQ